MNTIPQFKTRADFDRYRTRNQSAMNEFNRKQRLKKGRKKYKVKHIDVRAIVLGGSGWQAGHKVHMGDSLRTVPCPNCISKGMRQGLRQQASRSQIIFPYQQHVAKDIMDENKIPKHRKQKS